MSKELAEGQTTLARSNWPFISEHAILTAASYPMGDERL